MISALWTDKARSICGSIALAAGGVGYIVGGVIASTAVRTAVAFAQYCPNHGEPVKTPFGTMTCQPLKQLIEHEEVLLPLLSWAVPIAVCTGSLLLTYNYLSTGGISTCCRKRNFVDISQLGQTGFDHDRMFAAGE